MVKLIVVTFALFLLAATAIAGVQSSSSTSRAVPASSETCQLARLQCKADCGDLNGGALGACLRACDVEYRECLGSQSSATENDLPALEVPAELATSPEQCYLQLELCLESCDGDFNCNRQCARKYHTCLGH